MPAPPDASNRLICPNCHAVNAPYTTICASCGIRIEDYRTALPRLQLLKSSREASHRERLENERKLALKDEKRSSRRSFRKLLLVVLGILLVAGLVTSAVVVIYANRVKKARAEMERQYSTSLECMQKRDYTCARDGFQNLITSGAPYPDLNKRLIEARLGLARQLYEAGQAETAIKELNDLLLGDPGNQEASELRDEIQLGMARQYFAAGQGDIAVHQLKNLLLQDPWNRPAVALLNEIQLGLARQYFESGQWEKAVGQLKELLDRDPGNQAAVMMLKTSYDHWIDQLGLEGKFIQRWLVRRERDARFPEG